MIIFLFGEDEFRSNRKLAEIKQKFLEKNPDGVSGLFDFAEPGVKISELVLKLSSGGLFSDKKLAIVKNILQNKTAAEDKELLDFLKKTDKGETKDLTLVFWEKEKDRSEIEAHEVSSGKSKKAGIWIPGGSEIEKLGDWGSEGH